MTALPRPAVYLACPTLLTAGLIAACVPNPQGFDSPAPAARLEAVMKASREEDRDKIPDLITTLRSDDPAVRLFSIRTLEQLTGETLGYHYADSERRREDAIARWIEWYDRTKGNAESHLTRPVPAEDAGQQADDKDGDKDGASLSKEPDPTDLP